MKKIFCTLIFSLLLTLTLFSQTKGKVTYIVTIEKDSTEKPHDNPLNTKEKNKVLYLIQNASPVEAYLIFNDSISTYMVEKNTETPEWNNTNGKIILTPSGINLTWIMAGGKSIYYTDWTRNYTINQTDVMGSTKKIKGEPKEWTITEETKVVNGYLCYLAFQKNDEKIKAWYTPKIPVKHGPKGFNGLPGLILEIERGQKAKYNWKVDKIDFNTSEVEDIEEPTEGEIITEEEFKKWGKSILRL